MRDTIISATVVTIDAGIKIFCAADQKCHPRIPQPVHPRLTHRSVDCLHPLLRAAIRCAQTLIRELPGPPGFSDRSGWPSRLRSLPCQNGKRTNGRKSHRVSVSALQYRLKCRYHCRRSERHRSPDSVQNRWSFLSSSPKMYKTEGGQISGSPAK